MAKKNGSKVLFETMLDFGKETPGTICFKEDLTKGAPTCRQLYVPKHLSGDCQKIKVVVTAAQLNGSWKGEGQECSTRGTAYYTFLTSFSLEGGKVQ